MTKQAYLRALMAQPLAWIAASAADPSPTMRPVHVALHYIAIRRLTRAGRV